MNNDERLRPLFEAGLSARAAGALYREGIQTVEACAERSETELLRIPNLGRKSLNEIKEALDARGLKPKPNPKQPFYDRIATLQARIGAHKAAAAAAEGELRALIALGPDNHEAS
jgi:hypothetical protein